jgi:hypothetical protein
VQDYCIFAPKSFLDEKTPAATPMYAQAKPSFASAIRL